MGSWSLTFFVSPCRACFWVVAVVFVFGGKDKNTCPPFKLKACVHMLCLLRKYIRVPAHDRPELGQAGSVLYRGLAAAIYSH